MHSNKMYVNFPLLFFFFIILCFAPLISSKSLRLNYYATTCPRLEGMVWWGVLNATNYDPRMPASLLRLHFHDCFVNGCDASVLLDDTNGEKTARPNQNSLRGFEVIDQIKADVEKYCRPETVSCADILTLAAKAAVKIALRPDQPWNQYWVKPWAVGLGRLDGLVSNKKAAENDLPSPFDTVDTLISKFAAKGLDTRDMVVLSGAHTIGLAQCFTFKSRLYASNSSKIMDGGLLKDLQNKCPNVKSSDNNTVSLDRQTNNVFDNDYYGNLLSKAGVLQSDQALASDERTSNMVKDYSNDQELFMKDFGVSMVKMGSIQGNPNGEIRRICGSRN